MLKENSTLITEHTLSIKGKGNININELRLMHARNWDDFLHRDLKAYTFPRACFMLAMNTCGIPS